MDKTLLKPSVDSNVDEELIWAGDSFGEVIRRAREAIGLNQKQLARACRTISPMYISQIEKKHRVPSVRVCRLLASALNLNEQRLQVLAHRFRPKKELQDLLAREELDSDIIDNRFKSLLKVVNRLPEKKKSQIAKIWEDALKLVE